MNNKLFETIKEIKKKYINYDKEVCGNIDINYNIKNFVIGNENSCKVLLDKNMIATFHTHPSVDKLNYPSAEDYVISLKQNYKLDIIITDKFSWILETNDKINLSDYDYIFFYLYFSLNTDHILIKQNNIEIYKYNISNINPFYLKYIKEEIFYDNLNRWWDVMIFENIYPELNYILKDKNINRFDLFFNLMDKHDNKNYINLILEL